MSEEKRTPTPKKNWTKDETEALLKFYAAREEEFKHSRRKKYAYEHLLEDMKLAGFADSNTTSTHLCVKMQTLIRAYKAAKDNNNRTGAAPVVAPFMVQMDAMFGQKPIITNFETVTMGVSTISNSIIKVENVSPPPSRSHLREDSLTSSSSSDAPNPSSSSGIGSTAKKSKMSRATYFEKKLKILENEREERQKCWDEYMKLQKEKENDRKEKLELLKQILNKE